ncbi:hypothetical protein DPMN_169397 [Dreissena polymorpha]|uniref:Uncharacterized protein n=1 Tax=Dreissena polymorpha TaxID=45954 RepID=A0A9D4IBY8_DREPO|nr:hypothetical protein DPMN_169397 [Dreissena polymorpha]
MATFSQSTIDKGSEMIQDVLCSTCEDKLSGLGSIEHSTQTMVLEENPNKVFTVQGKSVHNLRISSDSRDCEITAICGLPEGQVLVADNMNMKVKLLDQQYQVVSHCSVNVLPWDMSQITPSMVAVTVEDMHEVHEVQFITVKNRKLARGMKLKFQHECFGIAVHQDDLFITADTALYKHTLSGILVNKMYEDTSGSGTGKFRVD